jgi:hypothetical protein
MRETATARITLDPDGVLIVRIRDNAQQLAKDALENLEAAMAETQGRRRPLLVDITRARPLDAEARHLYSGRTLVAGFKALALVVEGSPLGLMMGNVYFRVASPGIPARLFTDFARAHAWLKGHVGGD